MNLFLFVGFFECVYYQKKCLEIVKQILQMKKGRQVGKRSAVIKDKSTRYYFKKITFFTCLNVVFVVS